MATEYQSRMGRVQQVLERHGIQAVLLNRPDTIRHLTGVHSVCSWVLISASGTAVALVLESDYPDYRRDSILHDIRTFRSRDPEEHFRSLIDELDLKQGGLVAETDYLKTRDFLMLRHHFGEILRMDGCADRIVLEARMIKTPDEIEAIRTASSLVSLGMRAARDFIRSGITERELAATITDAMRQAGADPAISIMIGADYRSGLAHNVPSQNRVERGPVMVDIHLFHKGYFADMTRTFFLDASPTESADAYKYLTRRVNETVCSIKPGVSVSGLRQDFYRSLRLRDDWVFPPTGSLFHGVGLTRAEAPRFVFPWPEEGYPARIEAGVTMAWGNLGLYSPQGWGVRYEDTFLVTDDGTEVFTSLETPR